MRHCRHVQTLRAFTLVELSIVLVILGLLVGGVLTGQSLIRASELRAVTTEYSRLSTASYAFKDKYFALPGDMTNATSFWGTAASCPGDSSTPSNTAATCNGDGDGRISPTATSSNEEFRYWQHLANAGLIEGQYNGVSGNTTATSNLTIIGTNAPRSKMNSTGWSVENQGTYAISNVTLFEGVYNNVFYFGTAATNWVTAGRALRPEEAWNLDTKMDDGKPATGNVVSLEAYGTTCSDLAASSTVSLAASVYLLSNSSIACNLIFKTGF